MDTQQADFGRIWNYTLRGSSGEIIKTAKFGSNEDAKNYFLLYIKEENIVDTSFQIERENISIINL